MHWEFLSLVPEKSLDSAALRVLICGLNVFTGAGGAMHVLLGVYIYSIAPEDIFPIAATLQAASGSAEVRCLAAQSSLSSSWQEV